MKKKRTPIDILRERLLDIAHLSSVANLMGWDEEVNMPPKASDSRAVTKGHLQGIIHNKFVDLDRDGLLTKLHKKLERKELSPRDGAIVREVWKEFQHEKKIPESFVRTHAETTSKAGHVWAIARSTNNFALFRPWLEKIVKLKQQEAELLGYTQSPYDALLDRYEPGMTAADASMILNDLKDFLIPFIKKIRSSSLKLDGKILQGTFPIDRQTLFNTLVIQQLGFDMEGGAIHTSTHPFSTSFHPYDVRITTRYSTTDIFSSIGSTIHETGHALYEQGLPAEHFGTPLAESISLGIHESQSRLWENIIGRSRPFWKHFYPKLQKEFPIPFKKIPFEKFYRTTNAVQPSLIRTEADEVTYNLHIIIRFEIEKELIEGSIEVKDVPKIWKSKVQEYLGVKVPDDTHGVLQDVYWSSGYIGYFPTYTLGNLYSAQWYATMEKDIPQLKQKVAAGNFKPILAWLRKNIHRHGKTYRADALIKKVTGQALTSNYFIEYLKKKYGEIYGIS